ncbi:hypothetical protein HPG69_014740, partial [Diceros bicornis minor]
PANFIYPKNRIFLCSEKAIYYKTNFITNLLNFDFHHHRIDHLLNISPNPNRYCPLRKSDRTSQCGSLFSVSYTRRSEHTPRWPLITKHVQRPRRWLRGTCSQAAHTRRLQRSQDDSNMKSLD